MALPFISVRNLLLYLIIRNEHFLTSSLEEEERIRAKLCGSRTHEPPYPVCISYHSDPDLTRSKFHIRLAIANTITLFS